MIDEIQLPSLIRGVAILNRNDTFIAKHFQKQCSHQLGLPAGADNDDLGTLVRDLIERTLELGTGYNSTPNDSTVGSNSRETTADPTWNQGQDE